MTQLAYVIVLILVIPLILDCSVLFLTLLALKHPQKCAVIGRVWSEVWLLGLGANLAGGLWMFLVAVILPAIRPDPFASPVIFLWRLVGAAITGVCLYFVEKHVLDACGLLTGRERRIAALALAIATAPYFYILPY